MSVVYVAGPYSAPDSWEREQNIRRAEAVSLDLLQAGHSPICIHTMSRYWFGRVAEEAAIKAGLELLQISDAVVLVEGWRKSKGTLVEIAEAANLNIPVHDSVHAFRESQVLKWSEIPNEARPAVPRCRTCGVQLGNDPQGLRLGFCSGSCARDVQIDTLPSLGTRCSECGEPQYRAPGGATCANGHGGAPPVEGT